MTERLQLEDGGWGHINKERRRQDVGARSARAYFKLVDASSENIFTLNLFW